MGGVHLFVKDSKHVYTPPIFFLVTFAVKVSKTINILKLGFADSGWNVEGHGLHANFRYLGMLRVQLLFPAMNITRSNCLHALLNACIH